MGSKFNQATGKVEFPKAGKGAVASVPSDMAYVAIPRTTMARLIELAYKDGLTVSSETEKGRAVQESKAARTYVLGAIASLLAKREKAETK